MGRSPACHSKEGLNRGAWTGEEDKLLSDYIKSHGEGKWSSIKKKTGLKRSGKSCRLRWLNYLRPDIKRGNISRDEEDLIIRLHKLLGNRWSLIAGRLPGRTDNEIKNYWNTNLAKKDQKAGKQLSNRPKPTPLTSHDESRNPTVIFSGSISADHDDDDQKALNQDHHGIDNEKLLDCDSNLDQNGVSQSESSGGSSVLQSGLEEKSMELDVIINDSNINQLSLSEFLNYDFSTLIDSDINDETFSGRPFSIPERSEENYWCGVEAKSGLDIGSLASFPESVEDWII